MKERVSKKLPIGSLTRQLGQCESVTFSAFYSLLSPCGHLAKMLLTLDPEIWTAAQSQLNNELQKEIEQGG